MQLPILIPINFDSENLIPLGPFYVIENFHEPCFVTDTCGNVKSFEKLSDAVKEADECQEGYIIAI